LVDGLGSCFARDRSTVRPVDAVTGVRDRDDGPELGFDRLVDPEPEPSPSLTNVSIDFSKFPFSPFNTVVFLLSSLNPISRSCASFPSRLSTPSAATDVPNTLDCLFLLSGDGDRARCSSSLCAA
jgi:hypothetical protein